MREDALKPTKRQQRDMIPLITKYDQEYLIYEVLLGGI